MDKLALFQISWEPEAGWMLLLPSRLPEKTEGGLILPESYIQKNNSGVCVKVADGWQKWLSKELLFNVNQEYRIVDSETSVMYYLIPAEAVLLSRIPPKKTEFVRVDSQGKKVGVSFDIATLQSSFSTKG